MNRRPLTWQFGDAEDAAGLLETTSDPSAATQVTPHTHRRVWLVLLAVALSVSWTTGFYLGRAHQTGVALEAQIQGRLDVEAWAWEQGDWDLFRSLLPPRTPRWRLTELHATFAAAAPQKREMQLLDYVVSENGGRIDAVVRVSVAGDQYDIRRTYRLLDGRWRLVQLEDLDSRYREDCENSASQMADRPHRAHRDDPGRSVAAWRCPATG